MCHAAAPARVADVEETSALEMPDSPAPISLDELAADLDFTPGAARVAACTAGCIHSTGIAGWRGVPKRRGRQPRARPDALSTRRAARDHQAATSARAAGGASSRPGERAWLRARRRAAP